MPWWSWVRGFKFDEQLLTGCGLPCFIISCMNPDDLQKLVSMKMPFGKHQGKLLADLPGNYLNWFAREGFPKGEIGRLLALMQEIDHNGLSHLLKPLRNPPSN